MPTPVEQYEPAGIDYGWIMQVTFIVTIVLGAPLLALLSTVFSLPTWSDRLEFAIAFGALLWFCVAIIVYAIERSRQ